MSIDFSFVVEFKIINCYYNGTFQSIWMNDRGSIPDKGRVVFGHQVQSSFVAHPASLSPASFRDLMRMEHGTNHSPPSTGVDKIMETLRNKEIEFVLATLKELQLSTLTVLLTFVCTL
jgi:hypothetical protein